MIIIISFLWNKCLTDRFISNQSLPFADVQTCCRSFAHAGVLPKAIGLLITEIWASMFSKTQNMFFFLLKMWYMMRHVELTSETVSHFLLARKVKASTKPLPQPQMWADICFNPYSSNENPWVKLPLIDLTIFLPFDRKRYLEATNNCTRRFTRHNLFDANRHTLVERCGCFFH